MVSNRTVLKSVYLVSFFLFACLRTLAADSLNFSLKITNLPFPPYQRTVAKLIAADTGLIYGIIPDSSYSKGRIFVIDRENNIHSVSRLPDDILQVDSVIFNSDITWTWDRTLTKIITLDNSGTLKVYEKDGFETEIARISGTRPYEKNGYQISRAFAIDRQGNVYTAGKNGFLFRYNPVTGKLDKLKLQLPAGRGREAWASLDAAAISENGKLYLGTFDGYIIEFDPATGTMINLGKPFRQQRIQALVYVNGLVFGVGGETDGIPRWFIYNPSTRSFEIGGTLKTEDNKLIFEPVTCLVITPENTIYGSFSGRLGNLFLIEPKK